MTDVRIRVFTDQTSAAQWAADQESLGYEIAAADPVDIVVFRRLVNGKNENAPIDASEDYFVVMAYNQKPKK
ncbi:MAG: hypothetical protein A4S12_05780 [Proteobacteria bacterium SG_bin5]|nr:hypothetical protein [Sphingomonas sp.]OQW42982.1 MAG: hypothetical protein A4S12_05780 [Proteobacteria bacterium SG_bin5]